MFHFNHLSFINKGKFSPLSQTTFVGFACFVIPGKTLKERGGGIQRYIINIFYFESKMLYAEVKENWGNNCDLLKCKKGSILYTILFSI